MVEYQVPVIVAGAGAAGAVAALAARGAGADVLLLEQDARASGTTSMSQGLICAAGTHAQRAAGVHDTPDLLFADIMRKTRDQTDPALARAIADGAAPTIDWLVATHGLPFELDERFRAAYGHSALRVHGWPGHGGEDVLGFLHARLAASGVDVLTDAQLADVTAEPDGTVTGVVIQRPDGARESIGCGALVLATGGFGADAAMVARHMPEIAGAKYNGHEGSTGQGIRIGMALGAATGDLGAYQGYAMLTDPQGVTVPPGFLVEGGILVNTDGHRFANELEDISGLVLPLRAQPGATAWVVFDETTEARCAHIPETRALADLNAARTAPDAIALAHRLGLPPNTLHATIDGAVQAARAGVPDETGRVWHDDRPPTPPFRALRVTGALYHTQGGLQVDGAARVLRPDGRALPNLFAAGGTARGVSGPSCWGYLPAMGLCAAVTFGRLAGESAARFVGRTPA